MTQNEGAELTRLLARLGRGERAVDEQVIALVYDELRRIAARYMRLERKGHSLQPTALVHEAYLRLVNQPQKSWKNRAHFFAIAALLMRQILVDHARRRQALKRGDGRALVRLDHAMGDVAAPAIFGSEEAADLIALDEALHALARVSDRQSRIVELRFFAGMSTREIAEALDLSERTVDREWAAARDWLYARLRYDA